MILKETSWIPIWPRRLHRPQLENISLYLMFVHCPTQILIHIIVDHGQERLQSRVIHNRKEFMEERVKESCNLTLHCSRFFNPNPIFIFMLQDLVPLSSLDRGPMEETCVAIPKLKPNYTSSLCPILFLNFPASHELLPNLPLPQHHILFSG
ncbi:hypothetical protein LINGRAHAP2_LOCUS23327 [Linum grandiflorum]